MRPLTFEERVAATEAIERVYDAHRIWPKENPTPKPPFEELVPHHVIEEKVRDTLRRSAALEQLWHRPITTEQLQAEMDRMARDTKDPMMLDELFRALGSDPALIAECLARPVLTERLMRTSQAHDRRLQEEAWWGQVASFFPATPPRASGSSRTPDGYAESSGILAPCDEWRATHTGVPPDARESHTAVWTGSEMIVWGGEGGGLGPLNTGGRYDPATDTWRATSTGSGCPTARSGHAAFWTGSEMIVWGGSDGSPLNTGGRYQPTTDGWTPTSTGAGCPAPRDQHSAVWTGIEMIIWGGVGGAPLLNTGARYAIATDSWTATSTSGACPSARRRHAAVWTGTEMIVWGGSGEFQNLQNTGGRYDPSTDSWSVTSTGPGCPSPRELSKAVWTGTEMIVWGGYANPTSLNTGGRYDPATDAWVPTSTSGACPSGSYLHTAIWTGSEMIVWGSGARYDPVSDLWTPMSSGASCPVGGLRHTAVWTGVEMIVWGGAGFLNTGGRYAPATDSWTCTSIESAPPAARYDHTAVWTGSEMIIWGGWGGGHTGGRYSPATDSWTPTSTSPDYPFERSEHTAVWTGTEMIVWGGVISYGVTKTGARYTPATDTWVATSTGVACPLQRTSHTAVWTGTEMIVWGGGGPWFLRDTGGRYQPSTDTWTPTPRGGACPSARLYHLAVWTGSEMIVWGGLDDTGRVRSGGRYSPATNTWAATSTAAACPTARILHRAVWTGADMIVWGGEEGVVPVNTGARYAPATDTWTATATSGSCPSPRYYHSAVWTGSDMIVWGGTGGGTTGGLYRFISVMPAWLPGGTVGLSYGQTVNGTGGTPGYTFALVGALPPGLSLDATGAITGTPVTAGTFVFDILATDSLGCTGSRQYQLTVACPVIALSPATLPDGRVGVPYNQTIDATGGTAPYTYTLGAGALPAGLVLSLGGVLWGTPSAPGSSAFTVIATDALGCQGTQPYTLALRPSIDFLLGAGLGQPNPPSVRLYTSAGLPTATTFPAYAISQWGANVASGDIDGPLHDEILTGPGPGDVFGPHVRGWDRAGTAMGKVSFYAYGTLRYGVNVGSGDVDGDAYGEMLTGPGAGTVFGPHVRGFDFDGAALAAIAKINFFAYGTLSYGANVAAGSVDADPYAEIATGPGPGPAFSPQVRGFNYDATSLTAIARINYDALPYAGYGVNVALGDVDADAYAEIAAAPGPGPGHPSRFLGHEYDGTAIAPLPGFDATPFGSTYGGRVGVGDVETDGREDLLCGAGRDPAAGSNVRAYRYTASQQIQRLTVTFAPFGALRFGVNVAAGEYGY